MRYLQSKLRHSLCIGAIVSLGHVFQTNAQVPDPMRSFEVATIKPVILDRSHPFDPIHFWAHVSKARASFWSMTLDSLITYAYGVASFQVAGPDWANADRFDIEAKLPDGADQKDVRKMLQVLLTNRFRLAYHVEKRDLDVYILTIGRHGERLKPSFPDAVVYDTETQAKHAETNLGQESRKSTTTRNADGSRTIDMGKGGSETITFDQDHLAMHYQVTKMSMDVLAGRLSGCLGNGGYKVVNQTGLKGNYQLAYDCPLATSQQSSVDSDSVGMLPSDSRDNSTLGRSLDLLGLKLEKRKMPTDVYVIDHVERPSEN